MFPISFNTWKSVCEMYFENNSNVLKSYLQWFPFSMLSDDEKEKIKGKEYYEKYIQSGAFVHFDSSILQTDNYLQKGDGSFRNSSLVSPILYLLLQSVGKTISDIYTTQRPKDISVYYSGNYDYMRNHYKEDYDRFYKEINEDLAGHQYFIKTDIKEFFGNININKLVLRIDEISNCQVTQITQNYLEILKELLQYCGNGHFPTIENSTASSYLATIIYLDEIDIALYEYISMKIKTFRSFKMIRYVDDLYILISSDSSIGVLKKAFNEIRNEYSSILKRFDLSLNSSKCCIKPIEEISVELGNSLYDEYVNGKKCEIAELCPNGMKLFIDKLTKELRCDCITVEQYNAILEEVFTVPNVEFTAREIFNYFIFQNEKVLSTTEIVEAVEVLIEQDISFISIDPKRLTLMIIRSESKIAIKAMLNHLFIHYREEKWNSYDTSIAVNYLIQSGFRHVDLLAILKIKCPQLYDYYYFFCKKSFATAMNEGSINKLIRIIGIDKKTNHLYLMYLMGLNKNSTMIAYSYFKNYFDRLTAHLAYVTKYDNNGKSPNYKRYYKEREIIKFYQNIEKSKVVIEKSHKLRNANPVAHASAELLDNNGKNKEILGCINDLNNLIMKYIEELNDIDQTVLKAAVPVKPPKNGHKKARFLKS